MKILLATILLAVLAGALPAAEPKALPGKVSQWRGFERHDIQVDGANAIVVAPKQAAVGRPWIWKAEFFDAFPNAEIAMVEA